ncbi:MAG: CHAT domain-containing protein, partial [Pirellulaceae bacterium]
LQALRGVLPTVRQLAALDPATTPLALARVLGGFVGICQLLPTSSSLEWDLFDSASWPSDQNAVQAAVLAQARDLSSELAVPSPANLSHRRVFLIAGCNRRTVVGLRRHDDSGAFVYLTSRQGDGTVPLESAHLDHAIPYFLDELHGALPHHPAVLRAIQDILSQGDTNALDHSPPTFYGSDAESQLEQALAAGEPFDGRQGSALRSAEIRRMLQPFVVPLEPEALATTRSLPREFLAPEASPAEGDAWSRLTISRVRQRRLEIHLAQGSITDVDARAYVLGLFREVTPSGAAAAVDRQLDGAISDFTQRRMFGGHVGELFVLPAGRRQLRADMVVFAGLGSFDGFRDEVVCVTAENVARLMIRTRVENLATVLIGAGTGTNVAGAVENMLRGFVWAIIDADVDQNFRRVTLCELDAERYQLIRQTLFRLAGTPLFDSVEVSFTELRPVPAPSVTFVAPEQKLRDSITTTPEPVYLIVRQEKVDTRRVAFSSSLLPPTSKAAILSDSVLVELSKLNQHLASLDSESLTFASLDSFGQEWTAAVLPPSIAAVLPKFQDRHLVVVHDADSSRLPWETMRLAKWSPARTAGLSHRYLADNLSVAKYLEQRRRDEQLHVLLIIDPTETLPGAESEARLIDTLLQQHPGFRVDTIRGQAGTRQKVLKAISSGEYDVLHYAGHAYFNPTTRSESGILCAHHEVLSGADLSRAAHLPSLVFFNACESARVRQRRAKKTDADVDKLKQMQVGFAEAMMRGGVANYVGTYWPVADAAAETFGVTFYGDILAGKSLGDAVLRARRTLFGQRELDWADYVHYGDHRFQVKLPPS